MRIVDLFSGAGGLTFGFYYRIQDGKFVKNLDNEFVFANEFDSHAAKAFEKNYPDINMINCDIKKLEEKRIIELIGDQTVDIVIGGPPCQSFSTVGQRCYDEKAVLYEEYLRLLKIIRPRMFLFENVTGILSMKETFYERDENGEIKYKIIEEEKDGVIKKKKKPIIKGYGDKVIDVIKRKFENIDGNFGYNITYDTLNAVAFGVPENRERVFIVGIRNDLDLEWTFPAKTCETPICIKDAISDLPTLNEGENITEYSIEPQNEYQRLLRGDNKVLSCHFCGTYGDKIQTVIKNVKQGQGKNDFNKLVEEKIIDEKYKLTSGYANTYGRLVENQPSTTITNNLATPSGLRCIHYSQNRALSPREGARIQSFPDWFQFDGGKVHVTTQIGNAVPPLLAMALAEHIDIILKG